MTKVKVFVYGRRRQQQRQQRRGYDNSSPDFRHGELKIKVNLTLYSIKILEIAFKLVKMTKSKMAVKNASKFDLEWNKK